MNKYEIYREIGGKIREIRREKLFTQQFVADKMNVKRTSITNFESGKQCPPLDFIYELCNFLDIDIFELLPDNDNRKSDQERREKVEIQSATKTVKVSKKTHDLIERIKNSKEHEIPFQKTKQAMEQYGP